MIRNISQSCVLVCCLVLALTGISNCTEPDFPQSKIKAYHFSQLKAELDCSQTDSVYLVIDLQKRNLCLQMRGVLIWDYPIQIETTSETNLENFCSNFTRDFTLPVRAIIDKHLFAAIEQTPDSILSIIGSAIKAEPDSMQRELPESFQITWGDGLFLTIETRLEAPPKSRYRNVIVSVAYALQKPFGDVEIRIDMDVNDALTLYRSTYVGMPSLIRLNY